MARLVVYFFGGGWAFFAGVGTLLLGLAIGISGSGRWRKRVRDLLAIVGGLLVGLSATPLHPVFYAAWAAAGFGWLLLERRDTTHPRTRIAARSLLVGLTLLAVLLEAPYHVTPTVPHSQAGTLFVIGDSVSAGISDDDRKTWPGRYAAATGRPVEDYSRMGATVGSALRQLQKTGDRPGVVLLQIGGNDLLGDTSAAQFERQLDQLLAAACRPGRVVAIFELPLPPLCNAYGRAQRRLARQYSVVLVPKRRFIGVLTGADATSDSIHLTAAGHQAMAQLVESLLPAQAAYGR